jgi:hypothetical protein
MRQPSSLLIVELIAPLVGRCVAFSADPTDCCLILQRLAARRRREARGILDPKTAAVVRTEAERFEKLLALVATDPPVQRGDGAGDHDA